MRRVSAYEKRMTTYLPAERVERALALRDAVSGPEPVLALWREYGAVADEKIEGTTADKHYLPLGGSPSEGAIKYALALLARAGARNLPAADDREFWGLIHRRLFTDLIDGLKAHLGERVLTREEKREQWVAKVLAEAIPGEEKLTKPLTAGQRRYIDKVRTPRPTERPQRVRIVRQDTKGAVLIEITSGRWTTTKVLTA
jgi:hypothetical protein